MHVVDERVAGSSVEVDSDAQPKGYAVDVDRRRARAFEDQVFQLKDEEDGCS